MASPPKHPHPTLAAAVDQLAETVAAGLARHAPYLTTTAPVGEPCVDDDAVRPEVQLLALDVPGESVAAYRRVIELCWPDGDPDDTGWWSTPLGVLCARHAAVVDPERGVSHGVAARILGRAKGTVDARASTGTLERHPSGGLSRSALLAEVAARWSTE